MSSNSFFQPARLHREDGSVRRVGFELEFSGLDMAQTVQAVASALNGSIRTDSVAEQQVLVDDLGTFNIELDWDFLKRQARESVESDSPKEWLEPLSVAAATVVPVEVVCPPIPIDQLDRLTPMIDALRDAGAVGTDESLIAAYGLHINTEIPSLQAGCIHDYLRAYSLLQWWLVARHDIDTTRRISPYIDLYSEAYQNQLYQTRNPDMNTVFAQYLEHNDSRNRALDMLPMLAEIDEPAVRRVVDDPKIKARPTFHYRLPDCRINEPDWQLSRAWNIWCVVERLAERPDDLDKLSSAFIEAQRPLIGVSRSDWITTMDQWLIDHALV